MSGLTVSENGDVAIAGEAMDLEGMNKRAESKQPAENPKVEPRPIHVFDLTVGTSFKICHRGDVSKMMSIRYQIVNEEHYIRKVGNYEIVKKIPQIWLFFS